ncbi:MAG: transglycosylase domain-containing protein [Kiritimatiellia bacterium]
MKTSAKIGAALLGALGLGLLLGLGVLWTVVDWTPAGSDVYPGGVVLRDAAGRVLRVSLGANDVDCRPCYTARKEDWIVKALVAAEDGSFWTHGGVRPLSVLRAALQNVGTGRRVSGASTISMQTVRLISPHPKSLKWKIIEAVKAVKMEMRKDKIWILSQYLNRAPFGSNFVGIEAAAHGWFGKEVADLGLGEAALLAGMVQAPSRFRPDRGLKKALKRRDYVLSRMEKMGMITAEQRQGAASVIPTVRRAPRPFKTPYFCDWVLKRLDRDGPRGGGDHVTTLDADIQQMVENALDEAAREGRWNMAAVVMRVDSGAVVAMDCSGDYFDPASGQVNTAVAFRPAGSTLKPFLMALAMDMGCVTPEERVADLPENFKGYRPANFDGRYRGVTTARDALVLSLNLPFIQLLRRTGLGTFGNCLRSLGLSRLDAPEETFGLGMAIGNVDVTLVELVSAYAALARGGIYRDAQVLQAAAETEGRPGTRVFSDGAAYLVSDMLSGEERSTASLGHMADVACARFAWKTGTSSACRDAWTVAWNPEYVVGVWCGHLAGRFGDKSVVGVRAAAPVAWKIARGLYPRPKGPWFVEPETVVRRTICSLSGQPAHADCPKTETGRAIEGRSSPALCPLHGRDAEGRPTVRNDLSAAASPGLIGKAEGLSISKPENDATFCLVPGLRQQRIACQVVGNAGTERLWWFVDGVPSGETKGLDAFLWSPEIGTHVITCATAEGAGSSVRVHVRK